MYRLFETILIRNGEPRNLEFHNRRLNSARKELFGCGSPIDLTGRIPVPSECESGDYRCRVTYSMDIISIETSPYEKRNIRALKLVHCDEIDYSFKYEDRGCIDELLKQRGSCDDILIVKNGLITDTSFSNIVFCEGPRRITPETPLLRGTKREKLLREGIITGAEIKPEDLKFFSSAFLINAMLDRCDSTIAIGSII